MLYMAKAASQGLSSSQASEVIEAFIENGYLDEIGGTINVTRKFTDLFDESIRYAREEENVDENELFGYVCTDLAKKMDLSSIESRIIIRFLRALLKDKWRTARHPS